MPSSLRPLPPRAIPELLKIAALERLSRVPRSTIHHYLNLGLLPRPRIEGPKRHLFTKAHLTRLEEIQALRKKGWGLPRIREHLTRTPRRKRPPRRSGPEADVIREKIIATVTPLFAAQGYDGVRLGDVARRLGIGKGTLYRYFESKQALFVDTVERVRFTLVPRETRTGGGRTGDFEDEGRRRAEAVLQNFGAYRTMSHLLASLAQGADADLARRASAELRAMVTNAEPYLRRMMVAGVVRKGDSELLAHMLWGALMGAGERLLLDSRYSLDEILEAYLAFVGRGMLAAPAG